MVSLCSFGQESKPKDIIKFNDGSEYRGRITEFVDGEYLVIEVGSQSVKVDGEQFQSIKDIGFDKLNFYENPDGFWYEAQFGVTVGQSNDFSNTEEYPLIMALSGYQFHRLIGVGLGAGYQSYSNINIVPIFATLRGDLMKHRIAPFYYLDAGYGIGVNKGDDFFFGEEETAKGGFLFASGIGARFKLRKTYLTTSVGWRTQKSTIRRQFGPFPFDSFFPAGEEVFTEKRSYRRVEIRIGIGF